MDDDPKTIAHTVAGPQTGPLTPAPLITHTCPTCGLEMPKSIGSCPRDGTPITIHGDPGLKLVGNYEFMQFIGAGGMGVIYKAKHPVLNRLVAIKMLHGHLVSDAINKRFQQEAEAVSSLDHRNIIQVHDFGVSEHNQPYMVMDFVEGRPLSEVLQTKTLSTETVLSIMIQLSEGLQHAHDRAVLHRDLKPSNIMITEYDGEMPEVKIVDFGIAKVLESEKTRMTQTGELIGTPQYMSPEQCRGGTLDQRSDVYALGCVMFEALTGKTLFAGHSMVSVIVDQMNTAPRTLRETRPDINYPSELEDLVAKVLAKDPNDRYQSMSELAADLKEVRKTIVQEQSGGRWTGPQWLRLNREQRNLFLLMMGSFATLATVAITSISFIKVVHDSQATHVTHAIFTNPLVPKNIVSDARVDERRKLLNYIDMKKVDDDLLKSFFDVNTGITKLDLSDHNISHVGMPFIGLQKDLRLLRLDGTNIADADIAPIAHMPVLERLYLDRTKVSDDGMKFIGGLPELKRLSIASCHVGDKGVIQLSRLNLIDLNLSDNKISGTALDTISKFSTLEHLDLAHFYPRGEKNLAALSSLKTLETLNLSDCDLSTDDLADVAKITSLRKLQMAKSKIEEGALQALKALPDLRELTLSATDVTPSTIDDVAKLPALETLDLSDSNAGDEVLAAIAEKMPKIKQLDVKNTKVTDAGIHQLSKLPGLQSLELGGTAVDPRSAANLEKEFNGCKVKF